MASFYPDKAKPELSQEAENLAQLAVEAQKTLNTAQIAISQMEVNNNAVSKDLLQIKQEVEARAAEVQTLHELTTNSTGTTADAIKQVQDGLANVIAANKEAVELIKKLDESEANTTAAMAAATDKNTLAIEAVKDAAVLAIDKTKGEITNTATTAEAAINQAKDEAILATTTAKNDATAAINTASGDAVTAATQAKDDVAALVAGIDQSKADAALSAKNAHDDALSAKSDASKAATAQGLAETSKAAAVTAATKAQTAAAELSNAPRFGGYFTPATGYPEPTDLAGVYMWAATAAGTVGAVNWTIGDALLYVPNQSDPKTKGEYYRLAGELAGGATTPQALQIDQDVILKAGKHIYFEKADGTKVPAMTFTDDGFLVLGENQKVRVDKTFLLPEDDADTGQLRQIRYNPTIKKYQVYEPSGWETMNDFNKVDADKIYAGKTALAALLAKTEAATTYLSKTDATATYLSKADAGKTYAKTTALATLQTKTEAATTFLSKTDAAKTYAKTTALANYLTTTAAGTTYATKTALGAYMTKTAAAAAYLSKTQKVPTDKIPAAPKSATKGAFGGFRYTITGTTLNLFTS